MLKITGTPKGEIDVKRFYLEGVNIEYVCPICGRVEDLDQYLSYPDIGKPIAINLFCGDCEHEWTENIRLNLTVEAL